jgi:preprotein translocase subunit SecB
MAKLPNKAEKLEAAKQVVDAERYSQYLRGLELGNIFLKDVKATLHSHNLEGKKSFSFSEEVIVNEQGSDHAVLTVNYTVKAKAGRRKITDIRAKYLVVLLTEQESPEAFFTLYGEYNLPLQLYPYLRECVHSLFSKMGLPPLVLPLRKFLVPDSKDTKKD